MNFNTTTGSVLPIWEKYQDFETFTREKDGDLDHFIDEWKKKMEKVQSAGCQYSDLLLGLKLIEKVNLDHNYIGFVISKLGPSSSESFLSQVVAKIKEQCRNSGVTANKTHEGIPTKGANDFDDSSHLFKSESQFEEESYEKKLSPHLCPECGFSLLPHPEYPNGYVHRCSGCQNLVMRSSVGNNGVELFVLPKCPMCAKSMIQSTVIFPDGSKKSGPACKNCIFLDSKNGVKDNHNLLSHNPAMMDKLQQRGPAKMSRDQEFCMVELEVNAHLVSCAKCPVKFFDEDSLSKHYVEFHPDVDKEELINSSRRSRSHSGFLKCSICDKNFMLMANLENHLKNHENAIFESGEDSSAHPWMDSPEFDEDSQRNASMGNEMKQEVGSISSQESITKNGNDNTSIIKKGPRKKCSNKDASTKIREVYGDLVTREENPNVKIPCEVCGKLIALKRMKQHMHPFHSEDSRRKVPCEMCGRSIAERRMQVHLKTHTRKAIECSICQKQFNAFNRLRIHMETHKTTQDYICSYCGKKYKTKNTLNEHLNLHTKAKPLPCKFCDKNFFAHSSLRFHVRAHHTGEKPYKCDVCDKRFYISYKKVEHMRLHTGEKPFPCHVCGRYFANVSTRKRHIRNVHKEVKPNIIQS